LWKKSTVSGFKGSSAEASVYWVYYLNIR
jgi:hypothetical protein